MTKCQSYVTVRYQTLVGLPKVGTRARAPRAGALAAHYMLSSCLEGTFGIRLAQTEDG